MAAHRAADRRSAAATAVAVRRRVERVMNRRADSFDKAASFDDYLERREEVIEWIVAGDERGEIALADERERERVAGEAAAGVGRHPKAARPLDQLERRLFVREHLKV